jgi:hypothetical protein
VGSRGVGESGSRGVLIAISPIVFSLHDRDSPGSLQSSFFFDRDLPGAPNSFTIAISQGNGLVHAGDLPATALPKTGFKD